MRFQIGDTVTYKSAHSGVNYDIISTTEMSHCKHGSVYPRPHDDKLKLVGGKKVVILCLTKAIWDKVVKKRGRAYHKLSWDVLKGIYPNDNLCIVRNSSGWMRESRCEVQANCKIITAQEYLGEEDVKKNLPDLQKGDRVIRGPDWKYATQNG